MYTNRQTDKQTDGRTLLVPKVAIATENQIVLLKWIIFDRQADTAILVAKTSKPGFQIEKYKRIPLQEGRSFYDIVNI